MNVPLRGRLAIIFAGNFAVLLGVGAAIVFWQFRAHLYYDFDQGLIASAETARKLFRNDLGEQGTPGETVIHIISELPFGDRTFVGFDSTGRRIVTSQPLDSAVRYNDAPFTAPTTHPVTMRLKRGPARVYGIELDGGVRLVIAISIATIDRQLRQLAGTLIGMLPFVLLVGGAFGAWGAGLVLRPVNQVAVLADEVGRAALAGEVDFAKLPVPTATDEIATVTTAFNRLVDRLAAAIARERGIAERQRTFLADAAHELRTPVAIIRSEAEVTLSGSTDPAIERGALRTIANEAERLTGLVGDLLFLARGSEPANPGPAARVFLDDLANEAVRRVRGLPEGHGRTIRWQQCEAAPVKGSPALLERAIVVLLHNALVHAPGSPIELSTGVDRDTAWIRVRDSGPGVPEADRERIFDRFVRVRPTGPGSGLGLPIARAVAVQHRGSLVLEPGTPGASFVLRIPADHPAA